jgi:phage recombination protein Bet
MNTLQTINEEINKELTAETSRALLATTFKGLDQTTMKQAIMEGMIRGFTFKDFLEKNVYAIPFSGSYSLITSVDHARKIGMRSNVVGISEPSYEEKDGKIISCTVTVKRQVGEVVGEYSAKVYFEEYNTNRNLWKTKPRTMLAKVAEMHALRKACPEELSQAYTEEEMVKVTAVPVAQEITDELRAEITNATTEEQLKGIYFKHKGLGKEFDALVVAQKKFILSVAQEENANS